MHSSFALKTNLTSLKTKVDTKDNSKNTFETGISKLVSVTFFNSINLSIASLRSIKNTNINEYIKNTVLNKIADIINNIKRDPLKSDTDSKIKSLIGDFQAKINDVIIKKEGGLIVKKTILIQNKKKK